MTCYSVQPRSEISVKGYGFFSFARNMGKIVGKNISKNLSGKYRRKRLDHAKQSTIDAIKPTSKKKEIQKTAEATGYLIANKIADKIANVSKTSPQSNSKTVTNEDETLEKDIYLQKKCSKLLMIF